MNNPHSNRPLTASAGNGRTPEVAESPAAPVESPAAPAATVESSASPAGGAPKKLPRVASVNGGLFIHPYTQQSFDARGTEAEVDSWVQCQIDAGKLKLAD